MNPDLSPLSVLLQPNFTYAIPRYQRTYQWSPGQWQGLARDVGYLAASGDERRHFIGILLLAEDRLQPRGPGQATRKTYDVIDGQQRLITLSIWLAALAGHEAHKTGQDLAAASAASRAGLASIEVASRDERPYRDALDGAWDARLQMRLPLTSAMAAYHYYRWILWLGEDAVRADDPIPPPLPERSRWWQTQDWEDLFAEHLSRAKAKAPDHPDRSAAVDTDRLADRTLNGLETVTITWDERIDEPQAEIFEALNGLRTELRQLDHVRNRVFLRLGKAQADQLYEDEWEPTELRLGAVSHKGLRSDPEGQFLYDFLIGEGEGPVSRPRSAAQLDQYSRHKRLFGKPELISEILVPAMGAWMTVALAGDTVAWGRRPPITLPAGAGDRIRQIRFYSISSDPLLMKLVEQWAANKIDSQALLDSLAVLESFWARHLLGGTSLSPFRSRFMGYMKQLTGTLSRADLRRVLECPTDQQVKQGLAQHPDLYRRLRPDQVLALLRGIERAHGVHGAHPLPGGKGESDFTVEHIAPQKLDKWMPDLKKWKTTRDVEEHVLHTLGNLTVATNSHNKSVGAKPLIDKQRRLGSEPQLWLNDGWKTKVRWTPREILQRTDTLLGVALRGWPW